MKIDKAIQAESNRWSDAMARWRMAEASAIYIAVQAERDAIATVFFDAAAMNGKMTFDDHALITIGARIQKGILSEEGTLPGI